MNLNMLRSELRKLSALADGWDASENIPVLERDLALEKLREIYDVLRFDADFVREESVADVPVDMDLDDVLSLGLIPEPEEESASDSSSVASEPEAANEEPVVERLPEPEAQLARLAAPELQPEAQPIPVITLEPEELPATAFIPKSEPVLAPAPVEVFELASVDSFESEEAVASPDPELASAPGFVADQTSESAASPFLETPPAQESVAKPEPAPRPVLASLFGSEEEEPSRHRHKQRVIMSLYGSEGPAPASSSASQSAAPASAWSTPAPMDAESESEDVFEEFSVKTINVSDTALAEDSAPADDIAPADESYGGEEPADEAPAELDDPTPEAPEETSESAGTVLGEVVNQQVQTLADTYAVHPDTLSDAAHRAPVGDLRAVIGLNDRFLLIRDLFDGDAAACDAALNVFNGFECLDDCIIHIAENYSWNSDSDGAKFLMDLLERKYA